MGCPQGQSGFVLEFLEAQSNFGSGPSSCYSAREVQVQSVSHSVSPTVCSPMDCSPPIFSVQGISQTRIRKWVAIPSPGDLPHLGVKHRSPALQADSLPAKLPGKPYKHSTLGVCFLFSNISVSSSGSYSSCSGNTLFSAFSE